MAREYVKVEIRTTCKGERCSKICRWYLSHSQWCHLFLATPIFDDPDDKRKNAFRCEACMKAEVK